MLSLPALGRRGLVVRLPMADTSAAVIADVLLDDPGAGDPSALEQALALDPPLLLWTICRAAELDDAARLETVADAAAWLARRSLDAFEGFTVEEPSDRAAAAVDPLACAALVDRSCALARHAAARAEETPDADPDRAFLLGIIHGWQDWFALSADGRPDDAASLLPAWFIELHAAINGDAGQEHRHGPDLGSHSQGTAGQASSGTQNPSVDRTLECSATISRVARAVESTSRAQVQDASDEATASDAGKRFIATIPGAGRRLGRLVARLRRLDALERNFAATLETEKLASLAELAAGAGHEINPPLAIISGRVQLFLRDEQDPERRHELAAINRQAMRVHEMIADMMLFARPEPPRPESLDVGPLLDRLIEELAPLAGQRQVNLRRAAESQPASAVPLVADPVQLAVAIRAVCINALEAASPGGRVELSATARDPLTVEITVHDDGPGISPEVRRHLFDPFYSGRAAGRGLGLGLAKCWRIVTNHGGRIEVDSTPGRGTAFRLLLPADGPPDGGGASEAPFTTGASGRTRAGSSA